MAKKIKKDKNLPVLLLEDIPQVGNQGEIKKIKRGFVAFLIRQKKAIVVNKNNLKKLENLKLIAEKNREERIHRLNQLKEEIEKLIFETTIRVGPNKEIYNSVSANDIISFLKKHDINVTRNQIELEKSIKTVGEYLIPINLGHGIKATLKIIVKEEKVNI